MELRPRAANETTSSRPGLTSRSLTKVFGKACTLHARNNRRKTLLQTDRLSRIAWPLEIALYTIADTKSEDAGTSCSRRKSALPAKTFIQEKPLAFPLPNCYY